jgi:hypothetical protein
MTRKKKPEPKPLSGAGSTKGQFVRPSSEPPSTPAKGKEPVQEIPIGTPVSPEEYRRLKARAEKASPAQQNAPANVDKAP